MPSPDPLSDPSVVRARHSLALDVLGLGELGQPDYFGFDQPDVEGDDEAVIAAV